jgi:hypothetical protein
MRRIAARCFAFSCGRSRSIKKSVMTTIPATRCSDHFVEIVRSHGGINVEEAEKAKCALLVEGQNSNTDLSVYDPYGRFLYFEISKKF